MKTIIMSRTPGSSIIQPPALELAADSAIGLPRRPLFLPDDLCPTWSARLYLAVRLSRLGKSVRSKFARRYFDACALALRLIPEEIERDLSARHAPAGMTCLFDGAIGLGDWLPLPADDDTPFTVASEGLEPCTLTLREAGVAEALEAVSRHATIKTGDLLLPCRLPLRRSVSRGITVSATVDGTPCLSIKLR